MSILFCTSISPFQAPESTIPLVQVGSDFPDDSMQSSVKHWTRKDEKKNKKDYDIKISPFPTKPDYFFHLLLPLSSDQEQLSPVNEKNCNTNTRNR